jgi:hypothetical protein
MSSNYDDFSGDVSPVNNNSSADSKLTDFILRKAQELKIRKVGQDMPMAPTERNGFTVVTKTTVVLDDQREFTKLNCICGQKRGIQDVETLVYESLARSTAQAIGLVEHLPAAPKVVETPPVASRFVPAGAPQEQKVYNHRHDKPMSPKQLKTIRDMAKQKLLHPETFVSDNMSSRELSKLNSAEANEVIQALMKVRTFKN